MTDRTKHTIRTGVQVALGLASAVPDVVAKVPLGATAIQVVAVAATVTHYFSLLESLPFFPRWLELSTASTDIPVKSPSV